MQTEKQRIVEVLMRQALAEAAAGNCRVSPNPRTGALILRKGKVIGKGRHACCGGPHAEINAMQNSSGDLRGTSMVVTLEPCCHYGKTPPCTEAIIRAGISEVYVGMQDPNPQVSGKGIRALKAAGIRVHTNILRKECEALNQPFIKMMTRGFPYIIAKAALTLDAFMADSRGNSKWISGPESRRRVHRMRAAYDAVLVGMGTVLKDDPELTVRDIEGDHPLRVVYDPRGSLQENTKLVQTSAVAPLFVICGMTCSSAWKKKMGKRGVRLITVEEDGRAGLIDGLRKLGAFGIQSVLAEGGAALHGMLTATD
jgi:diaminohydroxyphosphoribosylaminopyrimidine deaminase/5-amino-6-(5-phosphoribosylamino)uracil reductase